MPIDGNKILADSIRRLLRRGVTSHLAKIVNKTHGADLSVLFRSLSLAQQHKLFDMIIDVEQKGILFSELEEDIFQDLIEEMPVEANVEVLESMPADDVADILGRLPEDRSQEILDKMNKAESEEVEDLLRYDDDTAGGIMVPDFIALKGDVTAREAIESLQKEHSDVEAVLAACLHFISLENLRTVY